MTKAHVIILDFGSQYTQLITRRIRELGVYCEIRPCTAPPQEAELREAKAVILSGGPSSVTDHDAPKFDPGWLKGGAPVLGICYGMQLIAHLSGGKLSRGLSREYGPATVDVTENSALFQGFDANEKVAVWMSHGDHVEELPAGFVKLAESKGAPFAAMGDVKRRIYGIQFHPEVVHTPRGKEIISNFLFGIAGCEKNWNSSDFIGSSIERINASVGPSAQVICGLSGGVDSTVAAVLVDRAIGSRLHCIFVDNGLLRKNEAQEVARKLGKEGLGLNLTTVDASQKFLTALKGVTDPEKKRKIIGHVFIDVFDQAAHSISGASHLVQGTLYPDVIESVSVKGPSATIKTHHNVGGLPQTMKLKLIEPFRELFKDEVRRLGRELGLEDEILFRQPFPGPGLAVRILGEITAERLHLVREADHIFQEEVAAEGLTHMLWQSFAVLLPVNSVGVMGDGRTYEQTIALRAVTSEDGMTADWSYLPQALLQRVSNRIINEVRGINRVVLDISSKPPATIEWE